MKAKYEQHLSKREALLDGWIQGFTHWKAGYLELSRAASHFWDTSEAACDAPGGITSRREGWEHAKKVKVGRGAEGEAAKVTARQKWQPEGRGQVEGTSTGLCNWLLCQWVCVRWDTMRLLGDVERQLWMHKERSEGQRDAARWQQKIVCSPWSLHLVFGMKMCQSCWCFYIQDTNLPVCDTTGFLLDTSIQSLSHCRMEKTLASLKSLLTLTGWAETWTWLCACGKTLHSYI